MKASGAQQLQHRRVRDQQETAFNLARLAGAARYALAVMRIHGLADTRAYRDLDVMIRVAQPDDGPDRPAGRPARNGEETRFHAKAQRREEETLRCPR
jgi:hypothetical protein